MIGEKATAHDVADFFKTAKYFRNLLRFACTTSPQGITFLHTTVYKGKRFKDSDELAIKACPKPTETSGIVIEHHATPNSVFHGFLKGTVYLKDPHKIEPRQLGGILWSIQNQIS